MMTCVRARRLCAHAPGNGLLKKKTKYKKKKKNYRARNAATTVVMPKGVRGGGKLSRAKRHVGLLAE